ncbi:unnamed protein product [Durusdinium trenchii]|uniref:Integrase catalytic domain-containing protein n=1 Tax=Durusdinium trenchii TaxID=1381693 RepID=A0ABP0PHN1_9DINO
MLRWAADFILDTMDNDPNVDVYFEWTFPCSGWSQHPMVFLEHELRKRSIPWESCRIDGCNYGVRDRNNDLFLHKRWLIKTTDELFHKNFRAKVCPKNHRRTLIEGIETSRSAYYPRRMVEAIVRHWKRELVPLRHLKYLTTGSSEADHEVENWMRRQKLLHEPDALPAELVPDDDDPPEQPEEANPLAEISKKEQDQWLARLRHYHRAAGHPSNRSLQRLSKDAGLPAWKLHMAKNFVCETCQSLKLGGYSSGKVPPASTHSLYKAWQAVGVDASEWLVPNQKVKLRFLLFIDLATKLKSIYVVKQYDFLQMQGETATEVITGFSERWLVDKPKPEILVPDNSKTFKSREMHDFCSSIGIQLACPAEKESWAHGVVESAIKDLKMTASAIQIDQPHLNPRVSLMLACAALNSTEYTKGYSAFQWCYGEDYTLADEDLRTFREFENYEDHMSYESLVRARQDAETEWAAVKRSIDEAYTWGTAKVGSYRHAGTDIEVTRDRDGDQVITVNQQYYVDMLCDLNIPQDRLRCCGQNSTERDGTARQRWIMSPGLSDNPAKWLASCARILEEDSTQCRWLASDYDIADAMTKKRPECRLSLMKFLQSFLWCIAFDPTFTAAKKNAKRGKTAVKHVSAGDAQADSFLWADVLRLFKEQLEPVMWKIFVELSGDVSAKEAWQE